MKWIYILLASLVLTACKSGTTPAIAPVAAQPASPTALRQEAQTPASTLPDPSTPSPRVTQTEESTPTVEIPAPVMPTEAGNVAALPDPALYQWEKVWGGLELPVFLTGAGDGSGRLFIVSQTGVIYTARAGMILDEPFLYARERVFTPDLGRDYGERGLLGLAFHPRFAQNGYFYINYTDSNGDTVIARYTAPSGADQADAQSEMRLLTIEQPYANHNGGMLAFGADGALYIGMGDGGSQGDPQGNAQSAQSLLGKLLRVDVDQGDPYAIPADNPYANGGGRPEIWAMGLRNPWRFSFDPLTGDLYLGDVGQNEWEEIDFLARGEAGGANFGWNYLEGTHIYKTLLLEGSSFTNPVAEYNHEQGCSVTGGVVYRGMNLPEWQGVYLYGDYCSGRIWGLLQHPDNTWVSQLLFSTEFVISSFGVDEAGEVFLMDYQKGDIYRLTQK